MDLQNNIIGSIYTSQDRNIIIIENLQNKNYKKADHITITYMLIQDLFFIDRFRRDSHESVLLNSSEYCLFRVVNKELFLAGLKQMNSDSVNLAGIAREVNEDEKYSIFSEYAGEYFYLITTLYPDTNLVLEKEENAS